MLKTIREPVLVYETSIVDRVSDDSEVSRAKFKNMVISKSLAKFKLLVESSFKNGFSNLRNLTFTKLRQTFIKTLILHYFDPKYHSQIKTNVLDYVIGGVLD